MNKKERTASLNEAKVLSSLSHPNVINYVDNFLSRKTEHLCIVIEFAEGGLLNAFIAVGFAKALTYPRNRMASSTLPNNLFNPKKYVQYRKGYERHHHHVSSSRGSNAVSGFDSMYILRGLS